MKNIFKTNPKKILVLGITLISVICYNCSDYLDVNEDPNNPTAVPIVQLLTDAEINFNNITEFRLYSAEVLSAYVHQFVFREEQDQYGAKQDNITINNTWNVAYSVFTSTNQIIAQGTTENEMITVGMAQVLKGYATTIIVDIWGDAPYTEAAQLELGILSPVFEEQMAVYQSALDLIDQGLVNINSGQGSNPGTQDLYYGGDITKWNKFVNTLKLKLYNEIRLSPLFDASKLSTLISQDNFMASSADDFQFSYSTTQSPAEERNPLFRDSYLTGQTAHHASPWFYEILKGWNPTIHNNVADPRLPYYYFNQLTPGQLPPDVGDPTTGDPKADYFDSSTGFHSIRFGSVGPDRDGSSRNSSTYPGIFVAGGRYDDGLGGNADVSAGTGAAPHRILTYDEYLFIRAELINVGLVAGDARATLQSGIMASFTKVDDVVANSQTSQTVPVLAGTTRANDFIDGILAEYDAASTEKRLEIIMTQKWVATFGDPFDQYNDYRRTGYPILADPNGPSPEYQLDIQVPGNFAPLVDSETESNRPYQVSLFWPQSELEVNRNSPDQKDATTYTIFWDN
ncbi:SusD-like starch-binding protein associating with outer membrane [Winogradskyella pacifica]|uniref:SusD-like starch-binding protein associating with outer membrane n=1 Tax=Winogradskyella pacifica TaxID=664642 RepID=A0A3D9LMX6_9FLAO|nr:SusD/RagB family nutrient-binding outer membrane lipoprotein [Winogradskyella pacifica]REE08625.1 SusD-like starch-binding protein associating with outer membrane [Winogradskyella pacifica]